MNQCFWILPGWVGFNVSTSEYKIVDHRATGLSSLYSFNRKTGKVTPPTFPKLVECAQALGWNGNTRAVSQPTFV
jgi:hypothetical protein